MKSNKPFPINILKLYFNGVTDVRRLGIVLPEFTKNHFVPNNLYLNLKTNRIKLHKATSGF
jgi:hypothetical protein